MLETNSSKLIIGTLDIGTIFISPTVYFSLPIVLFIQQAGLKSQKPPRSINYT